MSSSRELSLIFLVGCGATLIMDIWLMVLRRIGIQTLNFAFIGRWVGHLLRGQLAHKAIGKTTPIPHEVALGWLTHYAVGVAFAAILVSLTGADWIAVPTLGPAVMIGVCTVAFPLLVMQPAMGLGIAASKTPAPVQSCIRSLANHVVFGVGLFLSACAVTWLV